MKPSVDFARVTSAESAENSGALGAGSNYSLSPRREEITEAILSNDLDAYSEVVFCGYGEPSCRLDDVVAVAREIKRRRPQTSIRINTNGQSDLILGRNTAPDYAGCFDTVSISLNSPTAEGYDKICHSRFGLSAFDAILNFAKEVKKYVPETMFSVVKEFISEEELLLCRKICDKTGVAIKVRDYIPPEI